MNKEEEKEAEITWEEGFKELALRPEYGHVDFEALLEEIKRGKDGKSN